MNVRFYIICTGKTDVYHNSYHWPDRILQVIMERKRNISLHIIILCFQKSVMSYIKSKFIIINDIGDALHIL